MRRCPSPCFAQIAPSWAASSRGNGTEFQSGMAEITRAALSDLAREVLVTEVGQRYADSFAKWQVVNQIDRPLIISDSYTAPNGGLLGGAPFQSFDVNLPGGVRNKKALNDADGEIINGTARVHGNMGLAMPITDEGSYVKPTALTIGSDIVIEPGFPNPADNTQGIALGYYSNGAPVTITG